MRFIVASQTMSLISSKSPSMRTKGLVPSDLSDLCFLHCPMEFLFFLLFTMKGEPNSMPPSFSTSVSFCPYDCSRSNSSTLIVACNIVFSYTASFSFAFVTSSFSLIVVSFFCMTVSRASFYASFFSTTMVCVADPSTTVLVLASASKGVSQSLGHLLMTPTMSTSETK